MSEEGCVYYSQLFSCFEIFQTNPMFTCSGVFDLLDPETEVRRRTLLLPFGWVPGFNILHLFGEFLLYDLVVKYDHRHPENDLICTSILGITQPAFSDVCEKYEWSKQTKWLRKFGEKDGDAVQEGGSGSKHGIGKDESYIVTKVIV